MLLFVLFSKGLFGVPGSVSRIIQLLVLIGLTMRIFKKLILSKSHSLMMPNFVSPIYIYLIGYFLLLIFSGVVGYFVGNYDLPWSQQENFTGSKLNSFINSVAIRPLFEYVVAAYFIIYFVFLPRLFLKTKKDLVYFFTIFKIMFIVSLLAGILDYFFSSMGFVDLIPRHIYDGVDIGNRYHGFGGEPRQAFVYLMLGLAIFHLKAYFEGTSLNKWWAFFIIIAAILTKSFSGYLGIFAFIGLSIVSQLKSLKSFFIALFYSSILLLFLYLLMINTEKIILYLESASNLWAILETGGELPYLMKVQRDSIYPLYDLTVKFREFNFFPIFFGSGLGSASVTNNVYDGVVLGVFNPNSQFVRLLYASGLFGLLFFLLAFTHPVKYLTKNLDRRTQNHFILYMLLLVGCSFGVRSPAPYIYLGVFISVMSLSGQNSQLLKHKEK